MQVKQWLVETYVVFATAREMAHIRLKTNNNSIFSCLTPDVAWDITYSISITFSSKIWSSVFSCENEIFQKVNSIESHHPVYGCPNVLSLLRNFLSVDCSNTSTLFQGYWLICLWYLSNLPQTGKEKKQSDIDFIQEEIYRQHCLVFTDLILFTRKQQKELLQLISNIVFPEMHSSTATHLSCIIMNYSNYERQDMIQNLN